MAFVIDFFTGFETGGGWPYGGNGTIGTTAPKTGTYDLGMSANQWNTFPAITGTPSEVYFSCWVNLGTNFGQQIYLYLTDGSYIRLYIHTDGLIYAFVNNTVSVAANGSHALLLNHKYNIQGYLKIANAPDGIIQVKVDGLLDIAWTGDTQPGAVDTTSYFKTVSGTASFFSVDNWFQGTGGWPGDLRVDASLPVSDVDENWIPSTGTDNFALINERPPVDTNYIYTETNLQQNRVGITDWDDTNKTPVAIAHWVRAYKDPANDQEIKILEDLGGTQSLSDAIPLTTTPTDYYKLSLLDPNGDPWANASIDALTVGVEAEI